MDFHGSSSIQQKGLWDGLQCEKSLKRRTCGDMQYRVCNLKEQHEILAINYISLWFYKETAYNRLKMA